MRIFATKNSILFAIMILAVTLRMATALYLGDAITGTQQLRAYDQISYDALAHSLLAGKGYSFDQDWYPFTPANTPTAHWSFLYPLFLASVYALVGYHPIAARLVQVLIIGILSPLLLYRLGSRIAGNTIGLLSAGLGTMYMYFVYYDATLMTESFFIIGVLTMLNLTMKILEDKVEDRSIEIKSISATLSLNTKRNFFWIVLGVVLGITALLRQTILLWVPFLLIWIYWVGHRQFRWWKPIMAFGVMGLFILPWTVRNYKVYGGFLPLNSNAGYALYSANHPNQGTHFDGDYAAPLPSDLVSKGLNEAQWNTALMIRGFQFILGDPHRYLLLTLDRVKGYFYFWFSSESDFSSNLIRVLSFGLYLPFFIIGIILSIKNWRKYSLLYLFIFVYAAMHILTWASIRYRLPVDAVSMPFAALAIVNIAQRFSLVFNKRTELLPGS
jgi:hypothetical protein